MFQQVIQTHCTILLYGEAIDIDKEILCPYIVVCHKMQTSFGLRLAIICGPTLLTLLNMDQEPLLNSDLGLMHADCRLNFNL